MADHQSVLILDFGGQYTQLIARRVRECHVLSEVVPWNVPVAEIRRRSPAGIILSGGPASVHDPEAPCCDPAVFGLGIPLLGICYGMQLTAHLLGGQVEKAREREYGRISVSLSGETALLHGLKAESPCWMSHTWQVAACPPGFRSIAASASCPVAAMACEEKQLYGVQFHPEVTHTEEGTLLLRNFLFALCRCTGDWTMADYKQNTVSSIRQKVGSGRILLALSGGVDSSVAAALLAEAVGDRLTCIFVDHGLMRLGEGDAVESTFSRRNLNFIRVNAEDRFLRRLFGITDPEQKRKTIGEEFIRIFEEESRKIGSVDYLAQGTIYPDVIESGLGDASVIKSHHNVGGLPAHVDFREILEPLRPLFKDEVRQLGLELGLPEQLVTRQPFPGPGLGIRIIGEITKEKLDLLRQADSIFQEEVKNAGLTSQCSQYFAALTNMRSVGVMGDSRSYDYAVALRCVETDDFMTADWVHLPYELLARISDRIVNEVQGINRVFYDITSKPPATVEYE